MIRRKMIKRAKVKVLLNKMIKSRRLRLIHSILCLNTTLQMKLNIFLILLKRKMPQINYPSSIPLDIMNIMWRQPFVRLDVYYVQSRSLGIREFLAHLKILIWLYLESQISLSVQNSCSIYCMEKLLCLNLSRNLRWSMRFIAQNMSKKKLKSIEDCIEEFLLEIYWEIIIWLIFPTLVKS